MRAVPALLSLLMVVTPVAGQDMPLSQILIPGEDWKAVGIWTAIAAIAAPSSSEVVYIASAKGERLEGLTSMGQIEQVALHPGVKRIRGLGAGPKGPLALCQEDGQLLLRELAGGGRTLATDLAAGAVAATGAGACYCTVPGEGAVYRVGPDGKKRKVAEGLPAPAGVAFWTDEGTLLVSDAVSPHVWTFRVEPDGSLSAREGYYTLRTRPGQPSGGGGIALDAVGRAYVASAEGVQVFDPTGRLSGVLLSPERAAVAAVAVGGPGRERLYVVCGGKLYARKVRAALPPPKKK